MNKERKSNNSNVTCISHRAHRKTYFLFPETTRPNCDLRSRELKIKYVVAEEGQYAYQSMHSINMVGVVIITKLQKKNVKKMKLRYRKFRCNPPLLSRAVHEKPMRSPSDPHPTPLLQVRGLKRVKRMLQISIFALILHSELGNCCFNF